MEKYIITATLVVRCEIEAKTRQDAIEQLEGRIADTMSWQAWGEGEPDGVNRLNWIDPYPIVTCVS